MRFEGMPLHVASNKARPHILNDISVLKRQKEGTVRL